MDTNPDDMNDHHETYATESSIREATERLHPAVDDAGHRAIHMYAQRMVWDIPPEIIMVRDDEHSPMVPLVMPQEAWLDRHPADVLEMLAAAIMKNPRLILDDVRMSRDGVNFDDAVEMPEIVGGLFVTEAYALDPAWLPPRDRAGFRRWLRKGKAVQHHPSGKARESRQITAVDLGGVVGHLNHVRRSVPASEYVYGAQGRIPESFGLFLGAFAGVWNENRS